uniref:DNA excision repair protein ERCC-6-like n=1 Tax=Seriola lalandi dorsalis TaxID=1841481 RepID=A0A3B4XLQ5_SERLL
CTNSVLMCLCLDRSLSMDTDDKMEAYHRFIQKGKDAIRQGEMHKALELFKLGYDLHQSQKLQTRIKKIEEFIAQNDLEEEDEEFVNINNSGLMLFKDLHDKLYDYQRSGVAFLYSLYRDGRKGGILADDMGLGKTIQVISFLSGMYDNELVNHTLLVMPTSLITNWTKEFAKWTPGMRVKEFHGTNKRERTRNLEKVQRRGGVIITTYTMLMNNWQQLSSYNGKEFTWDYMILDEAHKIKTTATKTAKSACAVPSKNRVLLTGTPVQNNLREMWALFDFACQGTLLGTAKTFKAEYENPITRAREKDATPGEKALGFRMSENLMVIIKPYFLRRTKSEVQKNKMNGAHPHTEEQADGSDGLVPQEQQDSGAVMPTLTRKNDLIVWTYLSAAQEDIYRQFITLDHIKELLLTTRSPLAELNILKKLCDHPRLLSAGAIAKLGLEESAAEHQQEDDVETDSHSIANVPDSTLISESGKLVFLFALLEQLQQEGHRTLVFAHYRKVLDIIERILGNRGFKVLRLDGTIKQMAERQRRITLFQTDKRYTVLLLTTQVGGVGITLTAASRVVIYDPSWNPATDAQAVDRAYRIGQTENVVIYRLITCGTVEEKIYRRQVFKDSLIRQNTGDKKDPFRYFSKQELKELFTLEDTQSSATQLQLQALHSRHRQTDPELDEHIAQLHAMEMFGISDHDLMFSLDVQHDGALEDQQEQHYIEGRVHKAQELMKAESELQMQLVESMASSTEPAWLRQPPDGDVADASMQELMDQSAMSEAAVAPAGERSLSYVTAFDENQQNGTSHSKCEDSEMELGHAYVTPLQNKRLSVLQASSSSFRAETSSRVSTGLESFEGNFNLQLEDSDAFSDNDAQDPVETEAEERKLLAELQVEGSFDVNRSLQLENSFQVLGASTPRSAPSGSTPLRSRKSVGGNTSVASRLSLLLSIIEDVENHKQDLVDEEEEEEDDDDDDDEDDEAEESDIIDPSHGKASLFMQHHSHTEEEEEDEEEDEEDEEEDDDDDDSESADVISKSGEEMSSDLNQSTGELELASTERMEQCTVETNVVESEDESYDSLVSSGKACYNTGQLDDALGFLLKAINIKPGDSDIQLMVIQLFQQLGQRR